MPPEGPARGQEGQGAEVRPAAFSCLRLRRRADFLKAAQARRQGTPGFLLQARQRTLAEPDGAAIRIGFTCSRKVGNAVIRNRARRRLREAARAVIPLAGRPGWDYVLVGRPETTVSRPFDDLKSDLGRALARIHGTGE